MNQTFLTSLQVGLEAPLYEVIRRIDRSGRMSLALLTDGAGRLQNVITDGDVRRGLLAGLGLDAPVETLLAIKARMPYLEPATAPAGTSEADLLALMQARHVRQVPLLDDEGRVVDIVTLGDLLPEAPPNLSAVIMAGGFGTRLRPLTEDTPKPMLPVAGRPVLEWIVDQLKAAGIRRMLVTTHYKPEKIAAHFGDGRAFGVDMAYVHEDEPLGTAGSLGLIEAPDHPFLVINGDVLTDVNFQKMLDFHSEHEADLTVGLNLHQMEVPYGVVECAGPRIQALKEKPKLPMLVNAGIYLLSPSVYALIPRGEHFHMTDLIQRLLDAGRTVVGFPLREYWTDIGQPEDYREAQAHHAEALRLGA